MLEDGTLLRRAPLLRGSHGSFRGLLHRRLPRLLLGAVRGGGPVVKRSLQRNAGQPAAATQQERARGGQAAHRCRRRGGRSPRSPRLHNPLSFLTPLQPPTFCAGASRCRAPTCAPLERRDSRRPGKVCGVRNAVETTNVGSEKLQRPRKCAARWRLAVPQRFLSLLFDFFKPLHVLSVHCITI